MFEDGHGFALAHDPQNVMPYATWACQDYKTKPERWYNSPCFCPDREMGEAHLLKLERYYQKKLQAKVKSVEIFVRDDFGLDPNNPRPILEQLAEAERLAQEHRAEHGNAKTVPVRGGDR